MQKPGDVGRRKHFWFLFLPEVLKDTRSTHWILDCRQRDFQRRDGNRTRIKSRLISCCPEAVCTLTPLQRARNANIPNPTAGEGGAVTDSFTQGLQPSVCITCGIFKAIISISSQPVVSPTRQSWSTWENHNIVVWANV